MPCGYFWRHTSENSVHQKFGERFSLLKNGLVKRLLAFGSKGPRRATQVALPSDDPKLAEAGFTEFESIAGDAFGPPTGPFSTRWLLPRTPVNKTPRRRTGMHPILLDH